MSLDSYFSSLIAKVESSELSNQGKNPDGFFEPTKAVVLQRLNMLKDLHGKPAAKPMLRDAWKYVVEHVPPEWLVLNDEQKKALKKALE